MFGLLGHFRVGQSDVNAMLGDMSNLIGVDKPTAGFGIDHQPVKDILLLNGQHLLVTASSVPPKHTHGLLGRAREGYTMSAIGMRSQVGRQTSRPTCPSARLSLGVSFSCT